MSDRHLLEELDDQPLGSQPVSLEAKKAKKDKKHKKHRHHHKDSFDISDDVENDPEILRELEIISKL